MDPDDLEGTAELTLTRSLAAWGKGREDFKETLRDELEEFQNDLPIGSECGGWFSDGSAEVMVESVRGRKDEIRAKVSVLYESERPSGCSDFVYTSSHRAQLAVVVDKETGDASVEVTDHEEMDDRDEEDDDVDVGDDDGPREF